MRVEAGGQRTTATNGQEFYTDRQLTREQADVLAAILAKAGKEPDETFAVEVHEAGVWIEYYETDEQGQLVIRHGEAAIQYQQVFTSYALENA